jgi:hypothetical protein
MNPADRQPDAPLDLPPPFLLGADDAVLAIEEKSVRQASE